MSAPSIPRRKRHDFPEAMAASRQVNGRKPIPPSDRPAEEKIPAFLRDLYRRPDWGRP